MEMPVRMRARMTGISSINAWRSIYYACKVSVAMVTSALKEIAPADGHYPNRAYTAHPNGTYTNGIHTNGKHANGKHINGAYANGHPASQPHSLAAHSPTVTAPEIIQPRGTES
jgi:hypothetical protein